MQYHALYNHYEYYFPLEEKTTLVSSASTATKEDQKQKTRGLREEPPLLSSKKEVMGQGKAFYNNIKSKPLDEVVEAIEGPIREKGIYISKHSQAHFSKLMAKFDLTKKEDIEIYDKIELNLKPQYNKFRWAWPIGEEEQARLGICFSIQMNQTGSFIVHIKKGFKDVETFLKHYYATFNFLSAEEHARVIDLFYIHKTQEKAFDYVHLANKIGPKQVIDKEWKGARVKVKYQDLKEGTKAIQVYIDYSDPDEPEIEIEGPIIPSTNLRDILVTPDEVMPTINNMGLWSLETRNNAREIKTDTTEIKTKVSVIQETLEENWQVLELLQENQLSRQEFLMEVSELEIKLDQKILELDVKGDLNFIEIKKHFRQVLQGVLNNSKNIEEFLLSTNKEIENLEQNLNNSIYDNIEPVITGQQIISQKVDAVNKKITKLDESINQKFDDLKEFVSSEFKETRIQVKNNLYLVLRKLQELPGATVKELTEELNLPKSSVYYYFKKLQDKKMIELSRIKNGVVGRPSKVFKLTQLNNTKKGDGSDSR
jgi:DNA-binding MarR family transcriptional regulator